MSRLAELLSGDPVVVVFCGAGLSAASGVPTFRGAGGLWEGRPVEEVATPQGFRRDPARVWRFYAERIRGMADCRPNAAHLTLAEMQTHLSHFLLVTQNVDPLHEQAGSRDVIHLHGTLGRTRCTGCGRRAATPDYDDPIWTAVDSGRLPLCPCGELLRPDVVWFGENLDPSLFARINRFLEQLPAAGSTRLLLILGTSGAVGSYGLLEAAYHHGFATVEINLESSWFSRQVDDVVMGPVETVLPAAWQQRRV